MSCYDYTKTVKYLIESNGFANTGMFSVAEKQTSGIKEFHVCFLRSVWMECCNGLNALMLVSCHDYSKTVNYLVEAKASPDLQTQVCFSIKF